MSYQIRDLMTRVGAMIGRFRVLLPNSDSPSQLMQLQVDGEPHSDIEHVEPFGFTSCPLPDAEAVALFLGGDRSHGVVIAVGDRRYRVPGLKGGEVAVYNADGAKIMLKGGRVIEVDCDAYLVKCKSYQVVASDGVKFDTPLLQASRDIADQGGASTMKQMRDTYNDHSHSENDQHGSTGRPSRGM